MGKSARRFACLCLALGALVALPASASAAVKLGSTNIDESISDFGLGCSLPATSCTYIQKRLPGAQVRAPFSGEITGWNVVSPGVHSYQLVVMRKKRKGGKFKNVGESSPGATPGAGEYHYPASMPIRKGDYIGLKGDSVQGIFNSTAQTWTFSPAVEFPESKKPSFTGSDELQFNATLKR